MKYLLPMLFFALLALPVAAQPERYQAIAVPATAQGDQFSGRTPKVFILDTVEGHLWIWSENETVYGTAGPPKLGTVLIYQGRVRPGKRMGEIIEQDLH